MLSNNPAKCVKTRLSVTKPSLSDKKTDAAKETRNQTRIHFYKSLHFFHQRKMKIKN